jgi:N-acetylglucosaminyldiphosphoundecaprenol N-acetyl-beta-D-mannosaminyltransferase
VPVCLAIGGLFAYWSGDLDRAPTWLRRIGFEWCTCWFVAGKSGRYILGNPLFLARVAARRLRGNVTSP